MLKTKENNHSVSNHEFLRILENDSVENKAETPLRANAFELSNQEKIEKITYHFQKIVETLGLDLNDDSLKGTPSRVAKMYVNEVFSGLHPNNKPGVTLFENKFQYNQMLVEKNIKVHSYCEHHFVPIIGKAHIAYFSNEHVIGLSKINRIVDHFARRPQVQERLTEQIAEELMQVLKTDDVAVIIEAEHMCVSMRGIKDNGSSTTTSSFRGKFTNSEIKNEFLTYIYSKL